MSKEEKILALKEELKARARKKWPEDLDRQNRYVYGTINKVKESMAK